MFHRKRIFKLLAISFLFIGTLGLLQALLFLFVLPDAEVFGIVFSVVFGIFFVAGIICAMISRR